MEASKSCVRLAELKPFGKQGPGVTRNVLIRKGEMRKMELVLGTEEFVEESNLSTTEKKLLRKLLRTKNIIFLKTKNPPQL